MEVYERSTTVSGTVIRRVRDPRHLVLALGDDVIEEFAKSQVSFGSARKFVWLTPLTKEGASTR